MIEITKLPLVLSREQKYFEDHNFDLRLLQYIETVARKSGSYYPALAKGADLCTEMGKETTLFSFREVLRPGRVL